MSSSASSVGLRHTNRPQISSNETAHKEYVPQPAAINLGVKNVIFRLVNKDRKGGLNIDGIAFNIMNPKTKKLDTLRLLTGVYTPWQSEQTNLTDKYVERNRRSLKFVSHTCIIPETDTAALEFAKNCPSNIESASFAKGSKFSFYEYNPAKQAEEEAKKRQLRREAIKVAGKQDDDKVRKHGAYLGIQPFDLMGLPKSIVALRNEYEDYADANPDKFIASLNSPEVEVAWLIKKALVDNKIDLGRQPNSAYWANGNFITKIVNPSKAIDSLLEFALLPSPESIAFREQLQNNMI